MAPKVTRARVAGAAGLAGTLGGAATAIALQRRHRQDLGRDPDYRELARPLDGESFSAESADGTRLHAEAFAPTSENGNQPARATTFVLIHGWTERLSLWGPVIGHLRAAGMRPVAYDLRGHGRSDRARSDDYSLARFGEDVEAVLAAAGTGGRAVVVGHSLGAMSIAAWAEHHDVARRVCGAAMINTGLVDLLTGHVLFGELAARFNSRAAGRMLLGSKAPLPRSSSALAHSVIRHVAFGPAATTAQVAFFERMLLDCSPEVRAACGVAMADMDLLHAVARLTVPTLVVAGDRDRLTPPAHSRRIAEALPDLAGMTEMTRTGHMSPLERPRELTELLLELVARDSEPALAE